MRKPSRDSATRAAIYVRVSTGKQEENYSPDTQEVACRAYCAERGYVVADDQVYREVFSGAALYERPELSRLRQAVGQRLVNVVVSYSLDRLSRMQSHVAIIADEFERFDCRLEFVTENFEEGPVGTFIRGAKAFAAELEREKIRERTGRGLRARALSGKPRPGRKAPYGYQWRDEIKSGYVVDSDTVAVVEWIFGSAVAGETLRWIAAELNRRGVPSPTGRPTWHYSTVQFILSNPIYVGRAAAFRTIRTRNEFGRPTMKLRPDDEHIALPEGTAPVLIELETFEVIQARLQLNKERAVRTAQNPEAALLRAGYGRCGYCGNVLAAARSGRKGRYLNYRCGARASAGQCPGSSISVAALDSAVWSKVRSILTTPGVIGERLEWMKQHDSTESELRRVNKLIGQKERERETLVRHLARLDPSSAELVYGQLSELASHHKALIEEREAISRRRTAWDVAQKRLDELEVWCRTVAANVDDMTFQQKRLALDALGVSARIYKPGHTHRFEIEASIPMTDGQTVSNTR